MRNAVDGETVPERLPFPQDDVALLRDDLDRAVAALNSSGNATKERVDNLEAMAGSLERIERTQKRILDLLTKKEARERRDRMFYPRSSASSQFARIGQRGFGIRFSA